MYKKVTLSVCFLFTTFLYAQVGIGTSTPNPNSLLDVNATTMTPGGLLLPRLALTGSLSAAPLNDHVAGMTIYNTATAADVTPGLYYNNGSNWVRVAASQQTGSQQVMLRNGIAASGSKFNFPTRLENTITGASYNTTTTDIILPTGVYEIESNIVVTGSKGLVSWSLTVDNVTAPSSIVGTAFSSDFSATSGSGGTKGNTHQVGFVNITNSTAKINFVTTETSISGNSAFVTVSGPQCWLKIKKIQ